MRNLIAQNRGKLANQGGVTLVEVCVAMLIAGITILALMISFPRLKILKDVSHTKVAAIRACQNKVEDIRRTSFAAIPAGTTSELAVLDQGEDTASTADDLNAELVTAIEDVVSGSIVIAKKATVTCTWHESNTISSEYLTFVKFRNIS